MSTTWHEEHELIDDGADHDSIALDDWCSDCVDTIPAVEECGFCGFDCLGPFGPVVAGLPDGSVVRRGAEWSYCCDACLEDAGEAGWRRG